MGTSEAGKTELGACWVTPGVGHPQSWNLWWRWRGCVRASGGMRVWSILWKTGFGVWVGMLWASGAVLWYVLVVARVLEAPRLVLVSSACLTLAQLCKGYSSISSCVAWPSQPITIFLAYIEGSLIMSLVYPSSIPVRFSSIFPVLAFRLHILSIVSLCSSSQNLYPSFPCYSLGPPMYLTI